MLTSSVPTEQVDSLNNGLGTYEKPENPLSRTHLTGTQVNALFSKCSFVSEYVTLLLETKRVQQRFDFHTSTYYAKQYFSEPIER